jgi:hypothetical protein
MVRSSPSLAGVIRKRHQLIQEPIELSKRLHIDRSKPCCTGTPDIQFFVITHDDRSRGGYLEPFERSMENCCLGLCGTDIGAQDDGIEQFRQPEPVKDVRKPPVEIRDNRGGPAKRSKFQQ